MGEDGPTMSCFSSSGSHDTAVCKEGDAPCLKLPESCDVPALHIKGRSDHVSPQDFHALVSKSSTHGLPIGLKEGAPSGHNHKFSSTILAGSMCSSMESLWHPNAPLNSKLW